VGLCSTPALQQTGSRNLMVPKTFLTICGTYMKLVTKYQISTINSCWEKCDEKCAYMFNVYKNQLSRQTGSNRYHISWETFLESSDSYFLFAEERGYHKWALAHSSSCFYYFFRTTKRWVEQVFFLVRNVTKNVHICSMCIKTN
jgi:hypothetical protein